MSIISDPESWMGLRSARSMEGEPQPPPAADPRPQPRPADGLLGGMFRRVLRLFRRR